MHFVYIYTEKEYMNRQKAEEKGTGRRHRQKEVGIGRRQRNGQGKEIGREEIL